MSRTVEIVEAMNLKKISKYKILGNVMRKERKLIDNNGKKKKKNIIYNFRTCIFEFLLKLILILSHQDSLVTFGTPIKRPGPNPTEHIVLPSSRKLDF